MTMKSPSRYEIIYAPVVKSHVKALGRRYYSLIRRTIEEQLRFKPLRWLTLQSNRTDVGRSLAQVALH